MRPKPSFIAKPDARTRSMTDRPFGVNFLVPFLDPSCVKAAVGRARVLEWFYGQPDPALVAEAHAGDSLAGWQVGSVHGYTVDLGKV